MREQKKNKGAVQRRHMDPSASEEMVLWSSLLCIKVFYLNRREFLWAPFNWLWFSDSEQLLLFEAMYDNSTSLSMITITKKFSFVPEENEKLGLLHLIGSAIQEGWDVRELYVQSCGVEE